MTPEKIRNVQKSFEQVKPIANKAADIFYARLFETTPEVRPLFPKDMSAQKIKLMMMIEYAVKNLDQIETILGPVREMGVRHAHYGAKDEHYDAVGSALIHTLEKGLGHAFAPDVKEAWIEVYEILADVMKKAAAEASV